MNRPLALTGVVLSAAVVLTGCGGKKQASTVAASASARTATPKRAPSASVTVPGTVRVGNFCSPAGAVGRASGGSWARCVKRPGDSRPRWYLERPAPGGRGARPGQFCSPEGSTATSPSHTKLVCSRKSGETRPHWHQK